MKTRLTAFLLILLESCNSTWGDKQIETISSDSLTLQTEIQQQDTLDIKIDTIEINDRRSIQIRKNGRFNCLLSEQGDTIVKSTDYYLEAMFPDIDEDGYKDIRVFAFSNTPNQCDNYLFDKTTQSFRLIENCDLDIHRIKGIDFFYSYNRAGCADLNWESHLSKIENYTLVKYGYMYGQGCDVDANENPQVIDIYKVVDSEKNERTLMKSLPYVKHIPPNTSKWDFIETYWKQNIKNFER